MVAIRVYPEPLSRIYVVSPEAASKVNNEPVLVLCIPRIGKSEVALKYQR